MASIGLTVHDSLCYSGRLPALARPGQRLSALQGFVLVSMGVVAAVASVLVSRNLGVPGHNIIRVVFPMSLGLALVPRRGAGSVMGVSALATALLLTFSVAKPLGTGAVTSLLLTGILIDAALLGARAGWSIYLRLALAGLAANLIAFLVRAGTKWFAGGVPTGKPLAVWWPSALPSYVICGILAGLISAAVWFRVSASRATADTEGATR